MSNKSRKVTSVLLILIMVVAFSACGGSDSESALDLYNNAGKKLSEADSYSATMNMDMAMDVAGQSMNVDTKGNIKQVGSGDDMELETDMTTDAMGISSETKAYYKDGYYFMEVEGQKMKVKMDAAEALSQMNSSTVEIPEDAVKDSSVTDKDGGKEVSLTLDGQKLMDEASDMLGSMSGYDSGANDMKVGDFDVTAFIDGDGNLKSTTMKFNITMTIQGQETSVDATMEMTIDQVGGVTIDFPSDLDSYKETAA